MYPESLHGEKMSVKSSWIPPNILDATLN